tara:strand:+ start:324 stop:614 length:291 start_codon:yes stop_codon:yes gene_type:complete
MAKGPSYYQRGSTDVWNFIREQKLNFHLGNAIKYICRAGFKGSKIEDLEKAIHYLENELHHEKKLYIQTSEGIQDKIQSNEFSGSYQTLVSEKSDC